MLDSGFLWSHEEMIRDAQIRTGHGEAREVGRPFLWAHGKAIEIFLYV